MTNELKLYKFTNQKDSPYLDSLLAMFYSGASRNQIGIMESMYVADDGTETPAMILVGVSGDTETGLECFPLARAIPSEEAHKYLRPDGEGGYVREDEVECLTT